MILETQNFEHPINDTLSDLPNRIKEAEGYILLQPSAIQSSFGDISQLIGVLGGFKTAVNKHIGENEGRGGGVSKISHEFDEPIYEIDEVISRLREKLNGED